MKGFRNFISVILSIGTVLYLIFTPQIIMKGIEKSKISYWENKQENFSGIIELWHIVGFKAHTGSVSSWLKSCASVLEKKHFGVFIKVTAMTEEEYFMRLERGESADIYSFPLGTQYSDKFMPLDILSLENAELMRSGFAESGIESSMQYALPFMYSGYCFMENTELMQKFGIQKTDTPEAITNAAKSCSTPDKNAICGNSVFACHYGINAPLSDIENFRAQNACMAVCDFRAVGDAERKSAQGKGFAINAHILSPYTDLVQFISFDHNIAQEKIPYSYEFLDIILSAKMQNTLCKLNAYSVTEYENIEEALQSYTSIARDSFSLYAKPDIPNCFLYKRYKDTLQEDATLALLGDNDAKTRFTERMRELLSA